MDAHTNQTLQNKSRPAAGTAVQKQPYGAAFQPGGLHAEAGLRNNTQQMANNGSDARHTSQLRAIANTGTPPPAVNKKANGTGLPDGLKAGMENLSGFSMDDVKVHYNSGKPAQLQAHAYAQGSDIHLAPGQERHLPHEAWHVVQQKQGRVAPTLQMYDGTPVNDEQGLEAEATHMGNKALGQKTDTPAGGAIEKSAVAGIIQGVFKDSAELREDKFVSKAESFGLSKINAQKLYKYSGGNEPDPVTKLRVATEKAETRTLAGEYAANKGTLGHTDKVFYANIKFYNLAGLNAAKGHAGADSIFGLMAKQVDDSLAVLRDRYKVQGYRHEGSRFGFMISGDEKTLTKDVIEAELGKAKTAWSDGKAAKGIDNISNPKRPGQKGVDLGFSVHEITGNKPDAKSDKDDDAQGPADAGTAPVVSHAFQGAAPGLFKGDAESRKTAFESQGGIMGLKPDQIKQLYEIAGRSEKEPLTGFDSAGDRIGTLTNALHYFKTQWPKVFAGYVEVDVRNLGGLNDNLTRGDSDNVFRFMSDTTDKHMRSLKADVVSFRHGGDEFSFVVVGKTAIVEINDVRTVLGEAQLAVDAYVAHKKIWQKRKKDIEIPAPEGGNEMSLLNAHQLPPSFKDPLEKENIMKNKPVIETNTRDELWRIDGKETYWLIAKRAGHFSVYHIPLELTLAQILHSKNTPDKPRLPGTGIVWGASPVFRKDESPIDVVARADQAVEQKKK